MTAPDHRQNRSKISSIDGGIHISEVLTGSVDF
jgi:hypothetical protein